MVDSFRVNDAEGDAVEAAFPVDDAVEDTVKSDTPLIALRARRDAIVKEMFKDIPVPRWDNPYIYMRFTPVSSTKFASVIERRRKQKGEDWGLNATADIMVASCIGVYAKYDDADDAEKFSLRVNDAGGAWTKIDTDLARALGLDPETSNAAETCRALFLADGDLNAVADKLLKWSNIANTEADEDF